MSKVLIDQTKRLLKEWRRNRKYIREGVVSRELDLSSGLLRGWSKAMTKRRTKKRNTLMRKMAGQSGRASNLDFVEFNRAQQDPTQPAELPVLVRYRNRAIRATDIEFINDAMRAHPKLGRTPLSRLLCESWNWRGPGGSLKEYACRDLLLRLEEWGYLRLPPRQSKAGQKKKAKLLEFECNMRPIEEADLGKITVRPVRDCHERLTWRCLMDRHHYLGEGVMCGEHILYVATLPDLNSSEGERIVACLGWAAASLRNPKRDAWIGWDFERMREHLHLVVNNQRFLILPWVKIKNLGSRILSLNLQRLSKDWLARYGHEVALAETFVDVSRFQGTVYKAANWRCLGLTAGRSGYHRRESSGCHPRVEPGNRTGGWASSICAGSLELIRPRRIIIPWRRHTLPVWQQRKAKRAVIRMVVVGAGIFQRRSIATSLILILMSQE